MQPLMAYVIGAFALRLPHTQLLAVVVCASLPTAQNTFIFAQRYGVGEALASRSVLITTGTVDGDCDWDRATGLAAEHLAEFPGDQLIRRLLATASTRQRPP